SFSRDWSSDVCSSDLPPGQSRLNRFDDQRFRGAGRSPFLRLLLKPARDELGFDIYQAVFIQLVHLGAELGTQPVAAATTAIHDQDRKSVVKGYSAQRG